MPSAIVGGVFFVASIGLFAGLAYWIIRPISRLLAIIIAPFVMIAGTALLFPGMTPVSLLPFVVIGVLIDRMSRRDIVDEIIAPNTLTRREFLTQLGAFSFGGLLVSVIDAVPVYIRERAAQGLRYVLFDFTPPAPRVEGFDVAFLSPEVTPVESFYTMRKFATPIPSVPPDWTLTVNGLVESPRTFTLDDLKAIERRDVYLTRQCISNPVGGYMMSTALMSGVPLSEVVGELRPGVVDLVFYGRDGYSESVPVDYALENGWVIYSMNGVALPEVHGAPVRIEMPGLYGFKSMKWLDRIEAVDTHYVAIWEEQGWTSNPVVKTMSRIDTVQPTETGAIIAGVAFAGMRSISAVDVQVNGGEWKSATLHVPPLADKTWVQWRFETDVKVEPNSELTVAVRATDGEGNPQITDVQQQYPDGASGLHTLTVTL
jgi:DMSO/TMAO reductase YedYZ molybdopterin-dependent catalytic subunit